MDGTPDFLDPDDDDDGIPTFIEVRDGNALEPPNDDVDDNGLPNWRDADADGDGVPDGDEPTDGDDNGVPDYLEPGEGPMPPTMGGLSGGALCAVRPGAGSLAPLFALGLLGLLVAFRRRR